MPEDEADYDHIVNSRSLEKVQKDAIIMERLTASSYIVDAYGLCGTSIFAENMPNEVAELIIPGSGHAKQNELDRLPELVPGNKYSVEEKLDMAIDMAQALADIHGFPGGVIVHGDVHPVQWLQSPEGKLKLNDFNNAEILDWNKNKMRSCKTNRGSWGGNVSSGSRQRVILRCCCVVGTDSHTTVSFLPINHGSRSIDHQKSTEAMVLMKRLTCTAWETTFTPC